MARQRRLFIARGRVQGVGFRPCVWRLAQSLALAGHVANSRDGVRIELEGEADALEAFAVRLLRQLPPLARLDSLAQQTLPACGQQGFHIIASADDGEAHGSLSLPPDLAPCDDCLDELFRPGSRHWRHAFINCTNCGPRYSVSLGLPYDRARTTLAGFAQCPACERDYLDPASRRFHAEPNCCNHCGPTLHYCDAAGRPQSGDAVALALDTLQRGGIVALKSAGGFHLACDAANPDAVARLRHAKRRPAKPLALMVAGSASAARWVEPGHDACALLESAARPILLLPRRDAVLPDGVAPGLPRLGIMLPATPLHFLLFHQAAGRPAGRDWLAQPQALTLVMSSGNRGGEPVAISNNQALDSLSGIADGFLLHDRPIHARCDDSVELLDEHGHASLRRSRGRVPDTLRQRDDGASVLATGSYLKNAPCLLRGQHLLPGVHVGDLDHPAACRALDDAARQLLLLGGGPPDAIACDNGEHYARDHAARLAAAFAIPLISVGHHHAHIGAVCAEHGLDGPLLGLALDGFGVGDDGTAWGGELLRVDGAHCRRLGHLQTLTLPGGDAAAREPWRSATAWLLQQGLEHEAQARFGSQPAYGVLPQQLARRINCHDSSSMGRQFELVAALSGVCLRQSFEGEAAQRLEALAGDGCALAGGWQIDDDNILSLAPLLRQLLRHDDAAHIATLWHATVAAALADWVRRTAARQQLNTVALGGGCFANRRLLLTLQQHLQRAGLRVHHPQALPAGDGGLAAGQAWVARRHLAAKEKTSCV